MTFFLGSNDRISGRIQIALVFKFRSLVGSPISVCAVSKILAALRDLPEELAKNG